jgi:rhodanese-related sulfurtransferase
MATSIIIDIREEFELLEKQIRSDDPRIWVLNIPMRSIFSNKTWITDIADTRTVYIICRSGNRSSTVKSKYFADQPNVISLDGGIKKIESMAPGDIFYNKLRIVQNTQSMAYIGIQQYIQIVFATILLIILILLYSGVDTKYVIGLTSVFVLFILLQLYTKSCYMSSFFPLADPVYN